MTEFLLLTSIVGIVCILLVSGGNRFDDNNEE